MPPSGRPGTLSTGASSQAMPARAQGELRAHGRLRALPIGRRAKRAPQVRGERSELRGLAALSGIRQKDIRAFRCGFDPYFDERTAVQLAVNHELRKQRDAEPSERGVAHEQAVVQA